MLRAPVPVDHDDPMVQEISALAFDEVACTDRGRIMRLPGTVNQKRGRWCRIAGMDLTRPSVDPDRLRATLRDPAPPRPPRRTVRRVVGRDADELALVSPPEYFRALAGVEVGERGGYVDCPLPDHSELSRVGGRRAGVVVLRVLAGWWDLRPGEPDGGRAERVEPARRGIF